MPSSTAGCGVSTRFARKRETEPVFTLEVRHGFLWLHNQISAAKKDQKSRPRKALGKKLRGVQDIFRSCACAKIFSQVPALKQETRSIRKLKISNATQKPAKPPNLLAFLSRKMAGFSNPAVFTEFTAVGKGKLSEACQLILATIEPRSGRKHPFRETCKFADAIPFPSLPDFLNSWRAADRLHSSAPISRYPKTEQPPSRSTSATTYGPSAHQSPLRPSRSDFEGEAKDIV